MRISLLGPPGAGKGTQARHLCLSRKLPHVATGDMLREAVENKESVGLKAKEFMDAGRLVPDGVILELVRQRLARPDAKDGFVLDGFPRTIPQAKGLEGISALDAVIFFSVAEPALVERISGRRVCGKCKANYHVKFSPTRIADKCDACRGDLIHRSDDREEAVRQRLRVYQEQTAPLIEHYDKLGLLRRVDAGAEPDEVAQSVESALPE